MEIFNDVTLFILKGSVNTIKLYAVTIIFSIPLGVLAALGKISKFKLLRGFLTVYTWLFRGTPLLLQLFFFYYGLAVVSQSFKLSAFGAAALAFIFNYAAYFTEIFRAGIQSIDKGQYEAAKTLGMTYRQTMTRIVLPQMVKRVLPPTANEAIVLVKDTALVSAIAMPDILRNAKEIVTGHFVVYPFFIAAVIYLLFTAVVILLFNKLEKKYSVYD